MALTKVAQLTGLWLLRAEAGTQGLGHPVGVEVQGESQACEHDLTKLRPWSPQEGKLMPVGQDQQGLHGDGSQHPADPFSAVTLGGIIRSKDGSQFVLPGVREASRWKY